MTLIIDPQKTGKKLIAYLNPEIKKVLIPFPHGIGDVVLFLAPFQHLKLQYPNIHFDIGLSKGLDQESIVPNAILIDGNWENKYKDSDYDLIFVCHFPMENTNDLTKTKAEICCIQELGIEPTSAHLPIKPKPLVAVHFHMTCLPGLSNAEEPIAKLIWEDIIFANCTPIECHFEHVFHNPINKKYDFVDTHMRNCKPKIDTLMSLLKNCFAFIGVVSGNFHLALSILPYNKVMLLERELKAQHFTKLPIMTANLKNYKREVKDWLINLQKE
jgi:hypothetical protein